MTAKASIDVDGLVRWTYQDQRADVIIGGGVGLNQGEAFVDGVGHSGFGFDSCIKVRRGGLLGCKVDGGGMGRGDLHPDAEQVHEAIMELIITTRGAGLLVLQFGIVGTQPDWRKGASPRWEPCQTRQRPDGERLPVYKYRQDAGIGKRPWFCPMRMVDDPVSIDFARRVYDTWRGGLVALVTWFAANRNRLLAHDVTGPAVCDQPWKAHKTRRYKKRG